MSAKKMIKINPNFLKIGGKKGKSTKKKRHKNKDLRSTIKPNDIKKRLMNKIKDHQHRSREDKSKEGEDNNKKFTKDFNDQLGYLEKIIASKKKKKRKRKTKRERKLKQKGGEPQQKTIETAPLISISMPTIQQPKIIAPSSYARVINPPMLVPKELTETETTIPVNHSEPKYGCLKGGKKPTYSQYKKTLKKKHDLVIKDKINFSPFPEPSPEVESRKARLTLLKNKIAAPKPSPIKKFKKRKKTIKIHHLGKDKKTRVVGVLIKCGKTRKMVKNEQDTLRSRCLSEVKLYLRKHNLIKAGTTAPEDVLRKLYEDSFLAGNVFNKNPENLLFNYLNKELDN